MAKTYMCIVFMQQNLLNERQKNTKVNFKLISMGGMDNTTAKKDEKKKPQYKKTWNKGMSNTNPAKSPY